MKRGAIWKISVTTTPQAEDAVANLLSNVLNQPASGYTDAETHKTTVSAFCESRPPKVNLLRAALRTGVRRIKSCGLEIGAGRLFIKKLPHEDWAESWKRHFKPLVIGDALLIKPTWSKRRPRKGQALVVLDPGLSFGTGQHPTTEFCLRELVEAWERRHPCRRVSTRNIATRRQGCRRSQELPRSFLDLGTGSGILAIAAAKLGYAPVHAVDFDPQCVRIARANVRINHVRKHVHFTCADLTAMPRRSTRRYNLVCANLVANLLIAERDRILARVKPDGVLVVAGILKREFAEVCRAYEAVGMRLVTSKAEKEWRSGTFARSMQLKPANLRATAGEDA